MFYAPAGAVVDLQNNTTNQTIQFTNKAPAYMPTIVEGCILFRHNSRAALPCGGVLKPEAEKELVLMKSIEVPSCRLPLGTVMSSENSASPLVAQTVDVATPGGGLLVEQTMLFASIKVSPTHYMILKAPAIVGLGPLVVPKKEQLLVPANESILLPSRLEIPEGAQFVLGGDMTISEEVSLRLAEEGVDPAYYGVKKVASDTVLPRGTTLVGPCKVPALTFLPGGTLLPKGVGLPGCTVLPCGTEIPTGTKFPQRSYLMKGTRLPIGTIYKVPSQ